MSLSNAHVCPQCQQVNSPMATKCFMCGAAMVAAPMVKPPPVRDLKGNIVTLEESSDEGLRPGAYIVMGIGALLAVLGVLGIFFGLFEKPDPTTGYHHYGVLKGAIGLIVLGAGLVRVGMGNLDWTIIGLELGGKTQWGPVIMAPGTLGLPLGLLMWFGMREHGAWVVLVLVLSVISLGVGGFVYAREVIQGKGEK